MEHKERKRNVKGTGKEMDACKDCIRCQSFEIQICSECGRKTVVTTLDGPCMIIRCTSCGYEVIGASFYAPCEQDRQKYTLKIVSKELSKQQIMELRRLLQIRAVEINKMLTERECIKKEFCLNRLLEVIHRLEAMSIDYCVEPELLYSRILSCEKRMKIVEPDS